MQRFVKTKTIVLCDNVHREDNGKFVLAGVYTGGPIVRQIPALSKMYVFASFDLQTRENFELNFSISAEGFVAEGSVESTFAQDSLTIDLALPFYTLLESGVDVVFKWHVGDEDGGQVSWDVSLAHDVTTLEGEAAERVKQLFDLQRTNFFEAGHFIGAS